MAAEQVPEHLQGIQEEVIVSKESIDRRIEEMAEQMAKDYGGILKQGEELMVVCILKGSIMFTADLGRLLQSKGIPVVLEFMCCSSYGGGTESSGEVRVLLDLRRPMRGRHVLIVEDICESARTLDFLQNTFKARSPKSLKTVTLLDKPYKRKATGVVLDYVGFTIPDKFVVGYGLDYNEHFRCLPNIIVLKKHVYSKL
eukprot:Rhum_TRINITY_DN15294_c4_g1::Rhum_TRINITY_DN15294_c4_g1_i1::g.148591::m.148591/K00760/hprT, hpt, HPRT1; hypoxanthine phosphoribosyltransferase